MNKAWATNGTIDMSGLMWNVNLRLLWLVGGGGSLTSLMSVGRAKLETDRIIMQGKDTGLKMVPCSSDRFVVGENGETKKCVCEL